MLVVLREQLLDGTFADTLKTLQNFPVQDIHFLLKKAEGLKSKEYISPLPRPKIQQPSQHKSKNTSNINGSKLSNLIPQLFKISQPTVIPPKEEYESILEQDTPPTNDHPPRILPTPPKTFEQIEQEEQEEQEEEEGEEGEEGEEEISNKPKAHPLE